MSFRLFGVNVEIQAFFWITAVLLGMDRLSRPAELIVWVLVVLISILVHEMGHAFAIMRHRIEPEIALHGMGGTTTWRAVLPLRRFDLVVISLAGPLAGFLVAGLIFAVFRFAPWLTAKLPPLARLAAFDLLAVNIYWGIFNLIPVLPLDGGHVLEHALGPKRARITGAISFTVAVLLTLYFGVYRRELWGAMIFGMSAFTSYQHYRSATPEPASPGRAPAPDASSSMAPELAALLQSARHALAEEQTERAAALAQRVMEGDGNTVPISPRAVLSALEVIGWAHLLDGRVEKAAEALAQIRKMGEADAAFAGAVLLAKRDMKEARRVLEAARARGDDRKEVVGPLIQVLIEQGEVSRAAAVAFDIVDALSDDDARKMAQIAFEHRSFDWSARLFEAVFERHHRPDDAYEAARAHAQDNRPEQALDLLRRAVEAGFSDRARAWSDAALETLRAGSDLETLLPRP